jgi:hypothetical protein
VKPRSREHAIYLSGMASFEVFVRGSSSCSELFLEKTGGGVKKIKRRNDSDKLSIVHNGKTAYLVAAH